MKFKYKKLTPPPISAFSTKIKAWGFACLLLGFITVLQSCKPIQEITPEAKKNEMLLQAKSLFKKGIEASAARKASTNPRDIDISKLFPEWDKNRLVKSLDEQKNDILQVFIKKNADQFWALDYLSVNGKNVMRIKKYTKHDGCLTIYDENGLFIEKGNYNAIKGTYARFITRENLTKQARIGSVIEFIRDGDEWIVIWWSDSDGDGRDNAHTTRIPAGTGSLGGGDDTDPPLPPSGNPGNNGGGDDGGDGGGSSVSSGGGVPLPPTPPCTDADGCDCKDDDCKLGKRVARALPTAMEKVSVELKKEMDYYEELFADIELNEGGTKIPLDTKKTKQARVADNLQSISLVFDVTKSKSPLNNDYIRIKLNAHGTIEDRTGDRWDWHWTPASFAGDHADQIGLINGYRTFYQINKDRLKIIQENNTSDTEMYLEFKGSVSIKGIKSNIESAVALQIAEEMGVSVGVISASASATTQISLAVEKEFQETRYFDINTKTEIMESKKYFKNDPFKNP